MSRIGVVLFALFALAARAEHPDAPLLEKAQREKKPIVVLFRTAACERCDAFEKETLPHPAIARRLPSVAFAVQTAERDPHVALFDLTGELRARWPIVPDTTNFGIILDSVIAVAPHFAKGGDVEIAVALARLGRRKDARALLEKAKASGSAEAAEALAALDGKVARPAASAIRILPLPVSIVTGRQTVKTHVASAAVSRVVFSVDGREVRRVTRPPFSLRHDFGKQPERHAIRVVAYDRKGKELGRDERIVNNVGETFWIRIAEPRFGLVSGDVDVSMKVRVPPQRRIERVVVSWNDADRAVLTKEPWNAKVPIPADQVGILSVVAELDDGRTSEDAVLLNARGAAAESNVQLVQLPITILPRDGSSPKITADRISVREGDAVRPVESIATAADTPLTVGLLVDTSASMQKALPDLQETAIRFLETMLSGRDRAFLVSFDSSARLVQAATPDVGQLRSRIMSLRPNGLTALYDAIALGLLQFEGTKGRRGMIVFSDGVDRSSRYRAEEVAELARRVNIPIHIISAAPWAPGAVIPVDEEVEPELRDLARSTGGTAHRLMSLRELPAVYAKIDAALRAQVLAFVEAEPATSEREWRRVEVRVAGADAEVYAPEGYSVTW